MTMTGSLKIRDLIEVPPVRTVIRLEEGVLNPEEITQHFVFTPDVYNYFSILVENFNKPTGQGFFLQGDFGSGKSHFLAAVSALLSHTGSSETFSAQHVDILEYHKRKTQLLPIEISLVNHRGNTALETVIVTAIETALQKRGYFAGLSPSGVVFQQFKTLVQDSDRAQEFFSQYPDIKSKYETLDAWLLNNRVEAYTSIQCFLNKQNISIQGWTEDRKETFDRVMSTVRAAGFNGLVLLIDELSEFFRSKSDAARLNEDARTLQFLGEFTQNSPLWLICALQESVERTGDIESLTLKKIKDRFPVKLTLTQLHIRDLISKRLVKHRPGADEKIRKIFEEYKSHFPQFDTPFADFLKVYPLHPTTLHLLEGLGDLFSEHRGIVDFIHCQLAGDADRQAEGILSRSCTELLTADSIYEHFSPRISATSAFNAYPRHIIPHLDEVIRTQLSTDEDQKLARRLVRMIVLYQMHPTENPPKVSLLAEQAGCLVSSHDPRLNSQYVSEAILDPIVNASRYLARKGAIYQIVNEEDPEKNLKLRVERIMTEIKGTDSRLILEPLKELPESTSWLGRELWRKPIERSVTWKNSSRRALVGFVDEFSESLILEQIQMSIASGSADFGVVITAAAPKNFPEWIAVWQISNPQSLSELENKLLREYLATRMLSTSLKPSNPTDAPLITIVQESLKRLEASVRSIILNIVYAGRYLQGDIQVDPSWVNLKRFDRWIDAAKDYFLDQRYPLFSQIAPRNATPSIRSFRSMHEFFSVLGKLTHQEAREANIQQDIESIMVPLGLTELKKGAYLLMPDPKKHPFLRYFFERLSSTSLTTLEPLSRELRTGPYGIPESTLTFLIAALSCAGLISAYKRGKPVLLDHLDPTSEGQIDAISLGDLISEDHQQTLLNCSFLPKAKDWNPFGLKQQKEAWSSVIQFKETSFTLVREIQKLTTQVVEYSAFENFDFESLRSRLERLEQAAQNIDVSLNMQEGLERFLISWKASELDSESIRSLLKTEEFLKGPISRFVAIAQYMKHPAVAELKESEAVLDFFKNPEQQVIPDQGAALENAYTRFINSYAKCYQTGHQAFHFHEPLPELSKQGKNGFQLLIRLTSLTCIECPSGAIQFIRERQALENRAPTCRRNLSEELTSSPVCGCGYQLKHERAKIPQESLSPVEWEQEIEKYLVQFIELLAEPKRVESLIARSNTIRDMNPAASQHLNRLITGLREDVRAPSLVVDLLDPTTLGEIDHALRGTTQVAPRSLKPLLDQLSGRRLSPQKIRQSIDAWVGDIPSNDVLISIDTMTTDATPNEAKKNMQNQWWSSLHPQLFAQPDRSDTLESELNVAFPAAELEKKLKHLSQSQLIAFIEDEPFHLQAIRSTWLILCEQILANTPTRSLREQATAKSRYRGPNESKKIDRRLRLALRLQNQLMQSFPDRLRARVLLAEIKVDPWATSELQQFCDRKILELTLKGEDWLNTLDRANSIQLDDNPLVVILDGIPPDVWMDSVDLISTLPVPQKKEWHRLEAEPSTLPALKTLFDLPEDMDPIDSFALKGIRYEQMDGKEEKLATDLFSEFEPGKPAAIRIAAFDRAAHQGTLRLCDLPEHLKGVLDRQIRCLLEDCAKSGRRFILTTDHGMSLVKNKMHHGSGGVYERAVFRYEW